MRAILRVILQIEKCLSGAEAEEKRGAAESLAPTRFSIRQEQGLVPVTDL